MSNELEKGNITFTPNCNCGSLIDTSMDLIQGNLDYLSAIREKFTNYYDGYSIKDIFEILSQLTYGLNGCNVCKNIYYKNTYPMCNLNNECHGELFTLDLNKVIEEFKINFIKQ